jgi:hypothetical protein
MKKSKAKRQSLASSTNTLPKSGPTVFAKVAAKIPWLRNRVSPGGWQNLDDNRSLPPSYEKSGAPPLGLDTSFLNAKANPQFANNNTMSPGPQYDANTASPVLISPSSLMIGRSNTINTVSSMGQSYMAPNQMFAQGATGGMGQIDMQIAGHRPNPSLSSTDASYGGQMSDVTSTLRSGVGGPGAFFNQSELARQPSDAYDPARRQVNRASELSSLSSGFGDGDIIVPSGLQTGNDLLMPQPPPPLEKSLRTSQSLVGRFSWSSRVTRDTVYTQSSEDSPPRFRTVNSWVNQQTGRIKRAAQRNEGEEADVPPVPGVPMSAGQYAMPPEPQYNMMMPDGETPRKVEM